MNEGFTVFTERKIVGRMSGEEARHFAGIGGTKGLRDGVGFIFEKIAGTDLRVVGKTMLLLSATFHRIFISIKREVHTLTSNTNKLTYIMTLSHAVTSYDNV